MKKLAKLKKHHQLAYTLFLVTGLVGIWRGIWRLFDIYLFPNSPVLTYVASLVIGAVVLALTHDRVILVLKKYR